MRPGSYVVRRQDQGTKLGSWLCKRLNLRMNVVAELFARKAITVDGKIPSSLNVPMSANQIVCIGIGKKTQKQDTRTKAKKCSKVAGTNSCQKKRIDTVKTDTVFSKLKRPSPAV